ncbi:MAG: AAA family ATPase, partial [Nanoarchaeota archaeon]
NIFLKETGYDYIKINASDENSIDDIRTKVKSFATSMGITDKKIVYLNEMDFLSIQGQSSLRELMESVQKTTRFFFLVNYPHKVIEPLRSRCQSICLNDPPAKEIYRFVSDILKKEGVQVKNKVVIIELIKKLYPDIRQIINTLQLNSSSGILSKVKISSSSDLYEEIFQKILSKDIESVRKILRSETIDYTSLFKYLYEKTGEVKSPGD